MYVYIIIFYTFNKELIMMAIKIISYDFTPACKININIIYYNYDENNCDYKSFYNYIHLLFIIKIGYIIYIIFS